MLIKKTKAAILAYQKKPLLVEYIGMPEKLLRGQILIKLISEKINGIVLTAWIGVFAGPQLIISSHLIEGMFLTTL